MVHCLDGILLIRVDEQEVTNMVEVLVSPMCSRGWEGSPVKIEGPTVSVNFAYI